MALDVDNEIDNEVFVVVDETAVVGVRRGSDVKLSAVIPFLLREGGCGEAEVVVSLSNFAM